MSEVAYRFVLGGIVDRALSAGESLGEAYLAERLGASEAAVRAGVARLEALAIVDTTPDGDARLASFTAGSAVREVRAWAALHRVLLIDIWPNVPEQVPYLAAAHRLYEQRRRAARLAEASAANFAFFSHLRALTDSPSVGVAVTAAAYRLELAAPSLPSRSADLAVAALQRGIIDGVRRSEVGVAIDAIDAWAEAAT